jgi:hypothetical protein
MFDMQPVEMLVGKLAILKKLLLGALQAASQCLGSTLKRDITASFPILSLSFPYHM